MINIEAIEKVLAKKITCEDANVNYYVFNAYLQSKLDKQEILDFGECIWEKDIEPIITFCKENGIEEITISSRFSGLLETLEIFIGYGCEMVGLTRVNRVEWGGEVNKIPAMKLRIPR